MNLGNVSEFTFNKSGNWLAWTTEAEDRTGNGVQIRNMENGVVWPLDSGEATYRALSWTKEGDALALLKGEDDDDFEQELHSLLGFYRFEESLPATVSYDPTQDESFPEGMTISPNRMPQWQEDLSSIAFGIDEVDEKENDEEANEPEAKEDADEDVEDADEDVEVADLVIWHWFDKRMQSQQEVEKPRDEKFSYLALYRVEEKQFVRLADEELREVTLGPNDGFAIGVDHRAYQRAGSLDGRRYQDVYAVDPANGKRTLAAEKVRWLYDENPPGNRLLYYLDGHFFSYDIAKGNSVNITKNVPTSFVDSEDDHNVVDPPVGPFGWSEDGRYVLLYDHWDIWKVAADGSGGTNLTINGKKDGIRYNNVFRLDPEDEGIDLSEGVYINAYGEWTKKSGVAHLGAGSNEVKRLLWDDAFFSGLLKAKDSDVYLFRRETQDAYSDFRVAGADFANARVITDANPQQSEFSWSAGSMLVDYVSDKGQKLQAALFLPADYEEGKKYPTVVYIYEDLSQRLNRYDQPIAYSFNKTVYTSRGYAVLMPDIKYQVNDPGMSAVWCVLPALDAAIATGVVDEERVGLQGHSWGGYQTSFLVTQTQAFRAAVAGAPLTNMISMYSSIYWNTGNANQPIFESSQGRFEGSYLEHLEAYARNSPVYHARNVETPLLLLHNDKDGAVDWNQGIEYFNTLRRLEKPVVMLQYVGENHGLRKPANRKDYFVRMAEFFDHHLRGEPAPKWLEEGVSRLDLEDHLRERAEEQKPGKEEK